MNQFLKVLLLIGCGIACFGTLGMVSNEATFVMVFILFIPAPALGLIVALYKIASVLKRIMFLIICCLIYICTLYIIDFENIDYKLSAFRVVVASGVSAILFQVFFDLIFNIRLSIKDSISKPLVFGCLASVISTAAIVIFLKTDLDGWQQIATWVALFSIFPIWYFLVGYHLVKLVE